MFRSQYVILQIGSHDLLQGKSLGDKVGAHPSAPDRKPFCALAELIGRYRLRNIVNLVSRHPKVYKPAETEKEVLETTFQQNMEWLREAVERTRAWSARVYVLHTPDRDEVVSQDETFPSYYAPYRERFLLLCRKLAVPVLNLPLERRGLPNAASWFRDGVHLNEKGNREVAERLSTEFMRADMKDAAR